jgi:energy-converting hydrogenase Eha subunit F
MFKYISKILAQFSTPQKIVALSMLLLAIVIISIAPSFISSITLDRDELDSEDREIRI